MKRILAIAVLVSMVAACSTNYEKTKSGLAYKIFKGNSSTKLKPGDIIKFNVLVKISPKDTVWFSTYDQIPRYIPFDTASKSTHDFTEVLKFCSAGDSVVTISQVDTLVKMGMAQYNEMLKRGDQIVTQVKIIKVFNKEEEVMKDQQQEVEKKKLTEVADLGNYLKKKGINAGKTASGVYVEVKNKGTGQPVIDGKQITVDYSGYLISNGLMFDSNVDSTKGHVQPFSFVIGRDPIIPGWAEGLKVFSEGGSGTLYIPSMQAYGPRGSQPVIPPFSNLKFDVTVKKVADAPPPPPQQAMPGMHGQGDPRDPRAGH